ncbi:MAG TPA: FHA domain-containing protein [Hyphomicrobium sp.]|nr:FHA domain-containing protein [Hyphomicrobium sp.]
MLMQRTASLSTLCGGLVAAAVFSVAIKQFGTSDIVGSFQSTSNFAHGMITRGYQVAPALMLGLALLAVVPMIAVMSPIVFHATRPEAATRRYRPNADASIVPEYSGAVVSGAPIAYLEIVGVAGSRCTITRDMFRIGREDDNDIRIPSKDVHRYHAAIYRQHLDDWHIADLSGMTGNGVRVNGRQCRDVALCDGDIIELGPGRLRFRAGLS